MEARGGRTGRGGDELRVLEAREGGREWGGSSWESGRSLRRLEEGGRGLAEKDCSNGFGSRSRSFRIGRGAGRGEADLLFDDIGGPKDDDG